jgi:hypothetical protein
LIGVDVYFLTNPYVLVHLVRHDPVLTSNLGNSAAMYRAGGSVDALVNAARLIAEGASPVLALAGVVAAFALGYRAWRVRKDAMPQAASRRATGLLLAAPALLVLVQFVALAGGKPGEYGRFAILPDTFFAVEAIVGGYTFLKAPLHRRFVLGALALTTAACGIAYLLHFIDDTRSQTTRLRAAANLAQVPPTEAIAVENEPAPYSLPPVNLFTRTVVLLPRGPASETAVRIRPVDDPAPFIYDGDTEPLPRDLARWRYFWPARISWAAKTFEAKFIGPRPNDGLRG